MEYSPLPCSIFAWSCCLSADTEFAIRRRNSFKAAFALFDIRPFESLTSFFGCLRFVCASCRNQLEALGPADEVSFWNQSCRSNYLSIDELNDDLITALEMVFLEPLSYPADATLLRAPAVGRVAFGLRDRRIIQIDLNIRVMVWEPLGQGGRDCDQTLVYAALRQSYGRIAVIDLTLAPDNWLPLASCQATFDSHKS